jgi:hypothetical protein
LFSMYRRRVIQNVSPGAPDALHLHTLVYRRVVFKHVARDAHRPWKRNAAVACVIAPAVAVCVTASALMGGSSLVSLLLVVAQLGLYVVVYGRLVRGRWRMGRIGRVSMRLSAKAN